ncbi:MAG: rRNA maturation RNase YbeY [Clostridiales Family XIII bacterium]|jgi:probable rRNA maturation factor|nr:rRNA maturation RNase YbeY [Clostridiales Family XIII bacterium]
MMIDLSYDPDSPELPSAGILAKMRAAGLAAARAHGVGNAEISLVFATPARIRSLNREHRGRDEVTDVLSFPQEDCGAGTENPAMADGGTGPALLGDIVVCSERAHEQAEEYGHGAEREFVYLFVHGLLHLLGYDHETEEDRGAMRAAEEAAMRDARTEEAK